MTVVAGGVLCGTGVVLVVVVPVAVVLVVVSLAGVVVVLVVSVVVCGVVCASDPLVSAEPAGRVELSEETVPVPAANALPASGPLRPAAVRPAPASADSRARRSVRLRAPACGVPERCWRWGLPIFVVGSLTHSRGTGPPRSHIGSLTPIGKGLVTFCVRGCGHARGER